MADRAGYVEGECGPDDRCDECHRGAVEARLAPGHFYLNHNGSCSQNSALQVCERCGHRHVDRDFGQVLACTMDMTLEEGREMQDRIVKRLEA
jgi:hypothetical protein